VLLIPPAAEKLKYDDSMMKKISCALESPAPAAVYRVRAGDTLWRIARAHNVRPEQVRQWNKLKDNSIHPGMKLKLSDTKEKML
jgi:LysM repeat protein